MIVRGFDERRIRKQKLENIKQSHAGSKRKPYFLHFIFSYVFGRPRVLHIHLVKCPGGEFFGNNWCYNLLTRPTTLKWAPFLSHKIEMFVVEN